MNEFTKTVQRVCNEVINGFLEDDQEFTAVDVSEEMLRRLSYSRLKDCIHNTVVGVFKVNADRVGDKLIYNRDELPQEFKLTVNNSGRLCVPKKLLKPLKCKKVNVLMVENTLMIEKNNTLGSEYDYSQMKIDTKGFFYIRGRHLNGYTKFKCVLHNHNSVVLDGVDEL